MDRGKVDSLRKQIKSLGLDITIEDVMMGGFKNKKNKIDLESTVAVQIKKELMDKYKKIAGELEKNGYEINGRKLDASVIVRFGFENYKLVKN